MVVERVQCTGIGQLKPPQKGLAEETFNAK